MLFIMQFKKLFFREPGHWSASGGNLSRRMRRHIAIMNGYAPMAVAETLQFPVFKATPL